MLAMQYLIQFARHLAVSLIVLAAFAPLVPASAVMAPVVQTSQGRLVGTAAQGAHRYLGIPYAAPPVGERRWLAPAPPASWAGTRQASTYGAPCSQPQSEVGNDAGSEDCLYLNVYAPDNVGRERLPVMVWIHGGGFLSGSGSLYDLGTMAKKGRMVVVSINYRLGAFGFFRLPEGRLAGVPANFGLMDQQAALRWVQAEISQFGGDPSRVTLAGQSAGGASACMHMVSPTSAGLFHRVINQSGLCSPVGSPTTAGLESTAVGLAQALGCTEESSRMACLRRQSAAAVLASSATSASVLQGGLRWAPVPDGITLTGDPAQLVRQGRFQRVPMIFGTNHDDGRMYVALDYHLRSLLPVSGTQFAQALDRAAAGDAAFATTLAGAYTTQAYGTRDKALGALLTDLLSSCNSMRQIEDLARHTRVYQYEFNEPNTPGMLNPYMAMGAFHAVELRYLFQVKLAGPTLNIPLSRVQQKLADQMVTYWSSFAAYGWPLTFSAPYWPPFSPQHASALGLSSKEIKLFGSEAFRKDHHCALWDAR